jgi:hypothetical protein
VIRHDSKGSTKIAHLFYIWMLKQISKCHEPTWFDWWRRPRMTAQIITPQRMTASP